MVLMLNVNPVETRSWVGFIWFLKMDALKYKLVSISSSGVTASNQLSSALFFIAFSQMQCNWRKCSQSYVKSFLLVSSLLLIHFVADISLRMTTTDAVFVCFNLSILAVSPHTPSLGSAEITCLHSGKQKKHSARQSYIMLTLQLGDRRSATISELFLNMYCFKCILYQASSVFVCFTVTF